MATTENKLIRDLVGAIKDGTKEKTKAYETPATVTRIEDGVAWVHVPGGVEETPVQLTINASEGDQVRVRVANGRATIVGNITRPPTDDATAKEALNNANSALQSAKNAAIAAQSAEESAASAKKAANEAKETTDEINAYAETAGKTVTQILDDGEKAGAAAEQAIKDAASAKGSAENASEYAARALGNLSTVQNVTETLNWITAHGTMTLTTDTALDPSHVYFVADPNGDYTVGGNRYSVVTEPNVADISTYYELSIDESLNNYVATHLVVDSEGLWIIPDTGGNKVLIATGGTGHTYEEAGTYIIEKVDGVDEVVAKFTASEAVIGNDSRAHSIIDEDGMRLYSVDANDNVILLTNIGYGEGASQSGAAAAPFFAIEKGELIEAVDIRNVNKVYRGALYYDGSLSTKEYLCIYTSLSGVVPPITDTSTFVPIKSRTGNFSFTQGAYVVASGYASHAEGGSDTITEGIRTDMSAATGGFSHAEGCGGIAAGTYSHAEGNNTTALGIASHAEGQNTDARGEVAHAEGFATYAIGRCSHAEGYATTAQGDYSHSQNRFTLARRRSQTALGEFNIGDTQGLDASVRGKYVVIVGNGTGGNARSNALTIDWSGNVEASGDITDGSGNVLSDKADSSDLADYLPLVGGTLTGTLFGTRVSVSGNLEGENALLQLDTTAQSGVDKEIYDALVNLGWDSDVIV